MMMIRKHCLQQYLTEKRKDDNDTELDGKRKK
jgi:hypothetical protein